MIVFKQELRQSRTLLIVWAAVLTFMLGLCVVIYPELMAQMGKMEEMLAGMEDLSAAMGLTSQIFSDFTGYLAAEADSLLGLGGAFFAALLGAKALSREERGRTAEFLLTHPISRTRVAAEKLLAVVCQIFFLCAVTLGVSALLGLAVGAKADGKLLLLLFLAYFLLQLQIALLSMALSAFSHGKGTGLGLGVAAISYFLSILAALAQQLRPLRYLTPFGYAQGTTIVSTGEIPLAPLASGMALTLLALVVLFWQYRRKDIS